MPDRRWKREERAVARAVGGQRVGPTGTASADVVSEKYGVEVKSRKEPPAWFTDAIAQAERNCPPDKTPLLVICWCPGQGQKVRRYAVLDLDHFKELTHARPYTTEQRTEALDLLTRHGGDVQTARAELTQRWGHAPSLSTLTIWLLAGPESQIQGPEAPGKGITPPEPETRQDGALKGFEGARLEGATPMQQLLSAIAGLARSEDLVIIVIGKPGASGA